MHARAVMFSRPPYPTTDEVRTPSDRNPRPARLSGPGGLRHREPCVAATACAAAVVGIAFLLNRLPHANLSLAFLTPVFIVPAR